MPILYWAKIKFTLVPHSPTHKDPVNPALDPHERVRLSDGEEQKTPDLQVGRRYFAACGVRQLNAT